MLTLARGYSFCPLLMSVRSFLYPFYTLIILYCTNALSDQASSLALDWIIFFRKPRIPASFRGSATTFQYCTGLPCLPLWNLPNPGIEPRSPTLWVDSLPSDPPGKPKNSGVVAYPFSRGSSRPRNRTRVFFIAGRFFTSWATWAFGKCLGNIQGCCDNSKM